MVGRGRGGPASPAAVRRRVLTVQAGVLAAVLGLAACTGTPAGTEPDDPGASPTATASPAQPAAPDAPAAVGPTSAAAGPAAAAPELRLTPQARIALPPGMRGHRSGARRLAPAWTRLPSVRRCRAGRHRGLRRRPSRRPPPRGRPDRVQVGQHQRDRREREHVVWLDDADVRDGDALRSHWALRALDLRTRASWTIAEGGRPGDPAREPVAFLRDGRVTWQLFDLPALGGPVSSADLATRTLREVTGQLPGLLRAVTVARTGVHVVRAGRDPRRRRARPRRRVPAAGRGGRGPR